MCPIHWAAYGIAAIPASLAVFGFVRIRSVGPANEAQPAQTREGEE
jgi:hypothetical protein